MSGCSSCNPWNTVRLYHLVQMFELLIVLSDSEVRLVCRGLFPYLDSWWDIWWTVDGKTLEKLPDHQRFSRTNRWKENIWFYYLKGPRSRYRLIFKYDRKPQFGVYLWRVFELQRGLLASFSLQFWICGTFTDFNQPTSNSDLNCKNQKSLKIKDIQQQAKVETSSTRRKCEKQDWDTVTVR